MRSQSLIPLRSDSENWHVAASEDDTNDRNGKPFTPAHLTSSTTTIIATRENLHLAITSVLRMLHLPRDQQFRLG